MRQQTAAILIPAHHRLRKSAACWRSLGAQQPHQPGDADQLLPVHGHLLGSVVGCTRAGAATVRVSEGVDGGEVLAALCGDEDSAGLYGAGYLSYERRKGAGEVGVGVVVKGGEEEVRWFDFVVVASGYLSTPRALSCDMDELFRSSTYSVRIC